LTIIDSDMKRSRQYIIDNTIAPYAIQYVKKCIEYRTWNDKEFRILKNSIYMKYERVDLWSKLEIKGDTYV